MKQGIRKYKRESSGIKAISKLPLPQNTLQAAVREIGECEHFQFYVDDECIDSFFVNPQHLEDFVEDAQEWVNYKTDKLKHFSNREVGKLYYYTQSLKGNV